MKTVIEIITDHLRSIGADGLACSGCGCFMEDLYPCGCSGSTCRPGVKHPVTKEDHEAGRFGDFEVGEIICVPMDREKP